MDFKELMTQCKRGDADALEALYLRFKPLLLKKSTLNNVLDEDLFQLQCQTLLQCVKDFRMES